MAKKRRKVRGKKLTKGQLAWLWTKRVALGGAIVLTVRESYLALGSRREHRRAVYEQAVKFAEARGLPLIVLGDPDGGVLNHLLGRQWQCEGRVRVICIDPKGCGICADQIQGWPTLELAKMADKSAVIYDPGAFAQAENGADLAAEMSRVGVAVFMADAEPTSLTAFVGPGRKRRILKEPQANGGVLTYKPLLWHPENGGRAEVQRALQGMQRHLVRPPTVLLGLYR